MCSLPTGASVTRNRTTPLPMALLRDIDHDGLVAAVVIGLFELPAGSLDIIHGAAFTQVRHDCALDIDGLEQRVALHLIFEHREVAYRCRRCRLLGDGSWGRRGCLRYCVGG